ncbi:hypothetical protein D3C86_1592360 [compost metagenome]
MHEGDDRGEAPRAHGLEQPPVVGDRLGVELALAGLDARPLDAGPKRVAAHPPGQVQVLGVAVEAVGGVLAALLGLAGEIPAGPLAQLLVPLPLEARRRDAPEERARPLARRSLGGEGPEGLRGVAGAWLEAAAGERDRSEQGGKASEGAKSLAHSNLREAKRLICLRLI